MKTYNRSEKAREADKTRNQTDYRKTQRKEYQNTDKGKETIKRKIPKS